MSMGVEPIHPEVRDSLILLDLAEKAVEAKNLRELVESFLVGLAALTKTQAAFLFLENNSLHLEKFFQVGLTPEALAQVEGLCNQYFNQYASQPEPPPEPITFPFSSTTCFNFFLLPRRERAMGLVGLLHESSASPPFLAVTKALSFFDCALNKMIDRLKHEKQIDNLNTYMNISSMVAQALDLRDVLEAVLYFCMESFGVEAASVLLLDYEKKNFRFYSAEGPAKPVLLMASFPSDHGLAGSVLASQQPEVINDVQNDPRFFRRFDQESGFITRNMIALPLTAGEEKVGVLQVLNKFEGDFSEEELVFLQTIAEEIAFAIRNAKLFEVVVKSYCKQRQGEATCRGCKRPLGSWTPCVKYREEAGLL